MEQYLGDPIFNEKQMAFLRNRLTPIVNLISLVKEYAEAHTKEEGEMFLRMICKTKAYEGANIEVERILNAKYF